MSVHIVMFTSRKKDNDKLEGFKGRTVCELTNEPVDSKVLKQKFDAFVQAGQVGEYSRMYFSANARDIKKVNRAIVHYLIDNPEHDVCHMRGLSVKLAAEKECRAEKKCMFDFDSADEKLKDQFCAEIKQINKDIEIQVSKTPHGFAVITDRGFDMRKVLPKWKDIVEFKDDAMYCVYWAIKE